MSETAAPTFDELRARALAARAAGRHHEALEAFARAADLRPADLWTRNDIALTYLALGELMEADALASAMAREHPAFAPACRTLALTHRAKGDHEAALAAFREAARRDPRDLWNLHDAASSLRVLGRMDEAEAALRDLLRATPLAHSLRALGEIAREKGAGDEALISFQAASLLQPADPWFALDAARQAAMLGEIGKAEATLDRLTHERPGFAPAALERARLAKTPAAMAAARDGLDRALALSPGNEALALALADLLCRAGQPEEAETALARFMSRHPGSAPLLRALARAARERGDREMAYAHLKAALALAPDDCPLRLEWIMALRARGEAGEATGQLEALCADAAPPVEALLELHRLRLRRDGPEAARALLERARGLDPAHPRTLLLLGDDRRAEGQHAKAAALYREALERRPGFSWALIGLAAIARSEGRPDKAHDLLRAAAEAEPLEGQAQIEAAALCRDTGDFPQARDWLARVPATSPRRAEADMGQALILRAEGRWGDAAEAFETVAHHFPDRVEALADAEADWLRAGENARADAALARLALAAPDHPALREAQARRALIADDVAGALRLFEQALALDPARLGAWLGAVRARALLGDLPGALAQLAEIDRRFAPRPESAALQADLLRQTGRLAEAEAALEEGRRRHPHHAALWQQRTIAHIEAGALDAVEASLADPPAGGRTEAGRLAFVRSMLQTARWDFDAAMREGEVALRHMPGDGWVRNRLIHAALLGLDVERAGHHLKDLARLEAASSRLKGKSANASQSHYGQLHDDFRMDGEALGELRSACALAEPEARLEALRASVLAYPDSTIAALQWLIELRRQGVHPMLSDLASDEAPGPIPRRLHQFWDDGDPPDDVKAYGDTWRSINESFRYRLWSGGEAEAFLSDHGFADALSAFRRAREPAMKADLFRLALLLDEGGIYVDADDRCLRPIAPLLSGPAGFVAYQEDLGSLGNNWIAAVPGHPLLALALDLACRAVNRGDGDILWLSTGPGLLSRAAAHLMASRPAEVSDLRVVSRHTLSRFAAIHCLTAYKSTERHWSRTAFGRARSPAKAPQAA
ncbi:tetratricopeptide repeat protein [Aureimonas sp. D3]|uniref:tetratricopeptide repeat protein n=1 Tax=Aureimonas sp. D3 TaxID=1638164 RepID=UPI0007810BA7|nr:tetratricopeptide repeat protein [Aureimonas sp. D3]